jgi:hypothetical protein
MQLKNTKALALTKTSDKVRVGPKISQQSTIRIGMTTKLEVEISHEAEGKVYLTLKIPSSMMMTTIIITLSMMIFLMVFPIII